MNEATEEELENELNLIQFFSAISETPDIFATSVKIVQQPYTSLVECAFGFYFTQVFLYPFMPSFPLSLYDVGEFCVVQGEGGGRRMLCVASANSFSVYRHLIAM